MSDFFDDARVLTPEEYGTTAICLVSGCPSDRVPQCIERTERADAARQAELFGQPLEPKIDFLLGYWLACGHYISYAAPQPYRGTSPRS